MIHVVLAIRNEIVKIGFSILLDQCKHRIMVTGECSTPEALFEYLESDGNADVLVLDSDMEYEGEPVLNQLQARGLDLPVLVLSDSAELDRARTFLQAGANGYLIDGDAHIARCAIETVAAGAYWIDGAIKHMLVPPSVGPPHPKEPQAPSLVPDHLPLEMRRLTHREQQVICYISDGLTNTEIAGKLNIGRETVKTHVKNIMYKLRARHRTEIATRAVQPTA